jgi:argininosuccinate lyase
LFTRNKLEKLVEKTDWLASILLDKSEKHKDVLMPGYTHLQLAMPSSFGLMVWCLWRKPYRRPAFSAVGLEDYVNQNPLGSAAGYGSSFRLTAALPQNYWVSTT